VFVRCRRRPRRSGCGDAQPPEPSRPYQAEGEIHMLMIDVYATAGTFQGKQQLAQELARR
jgi:hypothetical protein